MRIILSFLVLAPALLAQNTSQPPVIATGGVLNAASNLANLALAPGALATLYGRQLADGTPTIAFTINFPSMAGGVTVSVNGVNAPLIYVSPTQINFQIPWETPVGASVPIIVTRDTTPSAPVSVSIAAAEAPSMFLKDSANGIAWVTGSQCVATECAIKAGSVYQLWANGLGPKNAPSQDGVPAVYTGSLTPLEVPGSPASCQLAIDGQSAPVRYCGAAPGEIIDQINFVYPAGVSATTPYVNATLTVAGVSGSFRIPAPGTPDEWAQQTLSLMPQSRVRGS